MFLVLWYSRRARHVIQRQRFRTDFARAIAAIEPGKSPVDAARDVLDLFNYAPGCVKKLIRPLRHELAALQKSLKKSTTWGTDFIDLDQQHQEIRDALFLLVTKWTSLEDQRGPDQDTRKRNEGRTGSPGLAR